MATSASREKMLGQTHFAEPNRHVLTSLHPKCSVQCAMIELLLQVQYSFEFELILHSVCSCDMQVLTALGSRIVVRLRTVCRQQ